MHPRDSLPIIQIPESRFYGRGEWRVRMPLALARLTAGGSAWLRLEDQGGLEIRVRGLRESLQITETEWYCYCFVDQPRSSEQPDALEAGSVFQKDARARRPAVPRSRSNIAT